MSLDGYVAGPDQSVENPLGEGGMALHEWAFALDVWRRRTAMEGGEVNASTAVVERGLQNIGADVMGRNMFGWPRRRGPSTRGTAGGARTRRSTTRCTSSPTTRASRWRCRRHDVPLRHRRDRVGARPGRQGGRRPGRLARRRRRHRPAVPGGRPGRRGDDHRRARPAARRRAPVRQPRRRSSWASSASRRSRPRA